MRPNLGASPLVRDRISVHLPEEGSHTLALVRADGGAASDRLLEIEPAPESPRPRAQRRRPVTVLSGAVGRARSAGVSLGARTTMAKAPWSSAYRGPAAGGCREHR